MVSSSTGSVSDIINDAENMPEPEESGEDVDLETAEPIEAPRGTALDLVALEEIASLPTWSAARENMNIPDHVTVADLVGKEIVIARITPQKAALPETGELKDGFFCDIIDIAAEKALTTWIGQIALKRDLSRLPLPFITTIIKDGRKYRFS